MSMILIVLPLVILFILTIFSFAFSSTFTYVGYLFEGLVNTEQIVNGSTTTIEMGEASNYFSLDPLLGALTWVTVIVILAVAIGIRVLASGLSDMSIKTLVLGTFYIAVFVTLSLVGFPYVMSIPYNFGLILYVALSIFYAVGIFRQVAGGSD